MNYTSKKQNILDAWSMVEHLSEGDIKIDHNMKVLNDCSDNYIVSIQELLKKKQSKVTCPKKTGILLYANVFSFQDVVKILRDQFDLPQPVEEPKTGEKFFFSLMFDADINLLQDSIFFTKSGYILQHKNIPSFTDFSNYEEENKQKILQIFQECSTPEEKNIAIEKLLRVFKIDIFHSYFRVLNNVETEGTSLHSFFLSDLENARNVDTENLKLYLSGFSGERQNLDSKKDSSNFNRDLLTQILQPKNYPLGRFPTNPRYKLSFMQQVAVNLAVGYDTQKMRSVNGPPGTGKTTLLKDIFADYIVQQAYHMAKLSQKKGDSLEQIPVDKEKIAILSSEISDKNIVVASSNNGAVQNIVNELPLSSEIDSSFLDQVKEVDYFSSLANSASENESMESKKIQEEKWGLFSLEGGKSQNMQKILGKIEAMVETLDMSPIKDTSSIYQEFLTLYQKLSLERQIQQCLSDTTDTHQQRVYKHQNAEKISEEKEQELKNNLFQTTLQEVQNQEMCQEFKEKIQSYDDKILGIESSLFSLPSHKSFFFSLFCKKNPEAKTQRKKLLDEKNIYSQKKKDLEERLNSLQSKQSKLISKKEHILLQLTQSEGLLPSPNFEQDYDSLQLSNPCFNDDFRQKQSELFILALKVRKAFLQEHVDSLYQAKKIWKEQNKYLAQDRRDLIEIAWSWINLAIPVISSTFASFARMCKNLGPNSLGSLFIDEAGQALPWAGVGAILRSKQVMVVGDPFQIKPVLTLDAGILGLIGKRFQVGETYLSESASIQTLVDQASQYGFYRDRDTWIGIPLWVHRRCQDPMFTLSNELSYGGLMVQANKEPGKIDWFDIKGRAENKFVREQAEFLSNILKAMMEKDPAIGNKKEKDKVYVITPFANVAFQLAKELDKVGFTRREQGKPTNIGTIHTFQGKEAPIVFMVLGADEQSKGAAAWAVDEANMMNVAATRAKKEFYLIGDWTLYKNLDSNVIRITNKVINKFKSEHPNQPDEVLDRQFAIVVKSGKGKSSFYSYLKGEDGKTYVINETWFIKIKDGEHFLLNEGQRVSFPKVNSTLLAASKNDKIYFHQLDQENDYTDIRPEPDNAS